MASVLNRTTREFIPSAHTPDYPALDWIHDPDMSAVAGRPAKYWLITGDIVTLADGPAQAAIDAAELAAARDATVNTLDAVEGELRAFALVVLDEINILRTEHALPGRTITQLKTAVRGKLGS